MPVLNKRVLKTIEWSKFLSEIYTTNLLIIFQSEVMNLDKDIFSDMAGRAYNRICKAGCEVYSLDDVIGIFKKYFDTYKQCFGKDHPNIRIQQIETIIHAMPYLEDPNIKNRTLLIDPESYPIIIEQHFRTKYQNCDYNINHFFSGDIRLLRYYETCY